MEDDLRVSVGLEAVALPLELSAQLAVVVGLAVVGDPVPLPVRQRHVRALAEVEDRQASGPQRHVVVDEEPLVVRAAVRDAVAEQAGGFLVRAVLGEVDDAADATHGRGSDLRGEGGQRVLPMEGCRRAGRRSPLSSADRHSFTRRGAAGPRPLARGSAPTQR